MSKHPITSEAPPKVTFNEPNADVVLLGYLFMVVCVLALFAFMLWSSAQPAVLRNAPLESTVRPSLADPLLLARDRSEETEQLAVETAEQENHSQGLQPLNPSSTVGMRVGAAETDAALAGKPAPKPGRVARTRPRNASPNYDPWQSWAAWGRGQNQAWNGNRSWSNGRSDRGRNGRGWIW